jgi:hypothetical protein
LKGHCADGWVAGFVTTRSLSICMLPEDSEEADENFSRISRAACLPTSTARPLCLQYQELSIGYALGSAPEQRLRSLCSRKQALSVAAAPWLLAQFRSFPDTDRRRRSKACCALLEKHHVSNYMLSAQSPSVSYMRHEPIAPLSCERILRPRGHYSTSCLLRRTSCEGLPLLAASHTRRIASDRRAKSQAIQSILIPCGPLRKASQPNPSNKALDVAAAVVR